MTEHRPARPDAAHRTPSARRGEPPVDEVDESSEESFPASDPPASWSGAPGRDPVVRPGGDGAWVPGGAPAHDEDDVSGRRA